jgi:hypothetical protein
MIKPEKAEFVNEQLQCIRKNGIPVGSILAETGIVPF